MNSLPNRYYYAILSLLGAVLAVGSFVLGREEGSASKPMPVSIICPDSMLEQLKIPVSEPPKTTSPKQATGKYVGSKHGTKYYLPLCAGAKRIKPENYIWFKSVDDAKLQGYTPGKC